MVVTSQGGWFFAIWPSWNCTTRGGLRERSHSITKPVSKNWKGFRGNDEGMPWVSIVVLPPTVELHFRLQEGSSQCGASCMACMGSPLRIRPPFSQKLVLLCLFFFQVRKSPSCGILFLRLVATFTIVCLGKHKHTIGQLYLPNCLIVPHSYRTVFMSFHAPEFSRRKGDSSHLTKSIQPSPLWLGVSGYTSRREVMAGTHVPVGS